MPSFLYTYIRFFVLQDCPVCESLLGFEEDDVELKTMFSRDCKVKNILLRQGFNLDEPHFAPGKVWFDRLRRGSQLRRDLALRRSKPDFMVDIETNKLIKMVQEYGVNYIRNAIFIDRFEVVNLSHPACAPLMYRYQVRVVPTVMTPYAPKGILRGLSAQEDELEIERLLFTGGSKIQPAQDVTRVR
jgi:hypothetical protein